MSDFQKILRMRVSGIPTAVAHTRTRAAADGYQYGGNARVLAVGGGAAYTRRRGAYTDVCLVWLDPDARSEYYSEATTHFCTHHLGRCSRSYQPHLLRKE